ncbi:type II CAAX endopeptidase family protein [Micromonospora sp. NPDC004551]|uniref:CPBP family intramembrane glutamic endopeptidase n=1 Tax=Micromonospora sp. NPDC004551 TaxID=3154284 RepID=UPI0033B18242
MNTRVVTTTSTTPERGITTTPARRAPRLAGVVGLYFAVTTVSAGLIGSVQPLLRVDPVIIELVQFGPTLGVLAVLLVWRGRWRPPSAVRPIPSPGVLTRLVAVAAVCAGLLGAVIGAYALLGEDVRYTRPGALTHSFWLIAAAQFLGACGEEFGWRGFLQPYLRTRYGVLTTGTTVGLLWGVWHVQVFAAGPAYAAAFLLSTIAMSVIMAVLLERARGGHLIIAGTFHAVVNLGLLLLMPEEDGDVTAMTVFAAACVLAALVVLGWAGARGRVRR